ncbi:MAG: hypothetical protein IT364_20145 [Candidatus Hydrogenedentes bacterium]|nr:hypothetical protein [Candidatus Hydrogenedentota bacterium]
MRFILHVALSVMASASILAQPLTLPLVERPAWLANEGIVMAGSWEPLQFRVRRDGAPGYEPTPEQQAAYAREHSAEMVGRLKALGVNFVMSHCYKGAGLEAERQSMADAVQFSKLCHEAGLRVGVYTYSGAFLWEPLFKELPDASNWVLLDEHGQPRTYGGAKYRYYWDRNHPDAQAFYKRIVEFAVKDIQTDLIHFDNYSYGPGSDANSVRRFQQFLAEKFAADQVAAFGTINAETVQSIMTGAPEDLLRRAWLDFQAQSLADSYRDMGVYARTLRKDILLECNPGGAGDRIRPPIDHGRLLQGGEAYWDEGPMPGLRDGRLHTRIQTYKIARRMNNMAFLYTTSPLEMAEAMAFNLDCLGCVCWFEYGEIVRRPGSKEPMADNLAPYIRFFHERRDLLRNADVVADIAVLRSFASQVFTGVENATLTAQVEQSLVEHRACFQIIYDHHLTELARYPILVLAGCAALSDEDVTLISRYVAGGGRIAAVGPLTTHDEWARPRAVPALDDLPEDSITRCAQAPDLLDALAKAWPDRMTLTVTAPQGLCAEVTEQPGRRLVHLVNYRENGPARDVRVQLRIPKKARSVTLASPERQSDVSLPMEENGNSVEFTVPEVGVYEIAIVDFG